LGLGLVLRKQKKDKRHRTIMALEGVGSANSKPCAIDSCSSRPIITQPKAIAYAPFPVGMGCERGRANLGGPSQRGSMTVAMLL
jgi:hypothetical protein